MRIHGMAWRPTLEMSGATVGLAIVVIALSGMGVVSPGSLHAWLVPRPASTPCRSPATDSAVRRAATRPKEVMGGDRAGSDRWQCRWLHRREETRRSGRHRAARLRRRARTARSRKRFWPLSASNLATTRSAVVVLFDVGEPGDGPSLDVFRMAYVIRGNRSRRGWCLRRRRPGRRRGTTCS